MLILTIGDLYIPERAISIPAKFKKLLQPKGKIEKVLCLGNASNSPSTLDFLKGISNDFQMIKGEDDTDPSLPQSLVIACDNLKIGLINGFQIIPKNDPLSLLNHARMMDVDVLIYGSTHKVEAYTLDGKFFINPGTGTGAYSTDPLDKEDRLMISKIVESKTKKEEVEEDTTEPKEEANEPTQPTKDAKEPSEPSEPPLEQLQLHDIDEYTEPFPSFCLLDVKDHTSTLYLYTLVDGDVKIDKLVYNKEQ